MKKKLIALLLAIAVPFGIFAACKYTPPANNIVPPPPGNEEEEKEYTAELDEVDFSTPLEAYLHGERYFNEDAKFYETSQYGTAYVPILGGKYTYVTTKRYKSDVTKNFIYETSTYAEMTPDPTFTLKGYKEDDSDKIYHHRVDGKNKESGAVLNPNLETSTFKGSYSVFNDITPSEKANWQTYKRDVGGNEPEKLTVYKVNANSVKSQGTLKKNEDGVAFSFELELNDNAIVDYRNQVEMYSKQEWVSFNALKMSFKMDKFGRILQINITENYRVEAVGAKVAVDNTSVEYIAYNKRPKIDFLDKETGIANGPKITYAALDVNVESDMFAVSYDTQGGREIKFATVAYYNAEIGELPTPVNADPNYIFKGWYTQPNGEGELYNENTIYKLKSDIKLYAYWWIVDPDTQFTFAAINDGTEYALASGVAAATVTIPATFKDKPVTVIMADIFKGATAIKTLNIPASIKSIGNSAFSGSGITTLNFETDSQLEIIGNTAFNGTKIVTLTLPENLREIGDEAFKGCTTITAVNFGEDSKLEKIGFAAFWGCSNANLTSFSIPKTVIEIGQGILYNSKVASITLTDNTKYVLEDGIVYNKDYTKVILAINGMVTDATKIRNSVVEIGDYAFYNVSNLYINDSAKNDATALPSGLTYIGEEAFRGCTKIAFTKLPSAITYINNNVFFGCTNLALTELPSGTTYIGNNAFRGCTNLALAELPSTVISIETYAFYQCSNITLSTLPSGLTSISDQTFNACAKITISQIPAGITSIGISAFQGCTGIETLSILGSDVVIGSSAFKGCSALQSVNMVNVTEMGSNVFDSCSVLKTITLPTTLKTMGTFTFTKCIELESIDLSKTQIKALPDYTFDGCTKITTVKLHPETTAIGNFAFRATAIASITLPNTITSIGNSAFYNLKNLALTTLPSALKTIGNSTFEGCESLAITAIPNGVETIGYNAFRGCKSITSIKLPSSITAITAATNKNKPNIGTKVFENCTNLKTVIIEYSLSYNSETSTGMLIFDAAIFGGTHADLTFYVPEADFDSYNSTGNYSINGTEIGANPLATYATNGKIKKISELPA